MCTDCIGDQGKGWERGRSKSSRHSTVDDHKGYSIAAFVWLSSLSRIIQDKSVSGSSDMLPQEYKSDCLSSVHPLLSLGVGSENNTGTTPTPPSRDRGKYFPNLSP